MTTTSTTSSSTATPASTPSAASSITTALGAGSGIDTAALVQQLVDAQFANKNAALTKKDDALTAELSSLSQLKSAVSGFSTALNTLSKGGTLTTQPTSSNTNILKASALPGASLSGLNATVEVRQIASSQVATSATPFADKSVPLGTGKLTLSFGTAVTDGNGAMTDFTARGTPIDITIDSTNNTLDGIAAAINAKNAGVTASVLSDADGSRLVLKGATGSGQAFTLTATEDAGHEGLAALNIGKGATGTTLTSSAADAIVAVDGVAVRWSTNSVKGLIPGVQLDLVSAQVGTKVNIGSTPPTAGLQQAVTDFVDTYNQLYAMLKDATDATSGPLRSDTATKTLMRQLQQLTVSSLVPGGAAGDPSTLSGVGVSTNRDGTLSLDSNKLAAQLIDHPDAVEAMFRTGAGLPAALGKIATAAADTSYGLGASEKLYTAQQKQVAEDKAQALADADTMKTRMTQQFATMESRVSAYKSTQTFLQQQIDAWNGKN
jgi:flagellar hook-associated protein 2